MAVSSLSAIRPNYPGRANPGHNPGLRQYCLRGHASFVRRRASLSATWPKLQSRLPEGRCLLAVSSVPPARLSGTGSQKPANDITVEAMTIMGTRTMNQGRKLRCSKP